MLFSQRQSLHRGCLAALAAVFLLALPVHAQEDALNLESAPVEAAAASPKGIKWSVEGAAANSSQRYANDSVDSGRVSIDMLYSNHIATGVRATVSNRLEAIHATGAEANTQRNSLREAYLSWQPEGGNTVIDLGRINQRNGPGYGYNPTDFFRDGSLRVITSADPFALRQNRMGSVMLRAQQLWNGGSLSVAYSPKLADKPSNDTWDLDLGSTNNRDRAVITLGTQFSQSVNSQVLVYQESGRKPTLGANVTALLSDAAVAHLEWTTGTEAPLVNRVFGGAPVEITSNRFVGGVTYTTLGKTSFTAEYQYNGFALDSTGWAKLGLPQQLGYLRESLRLQELAPRQAYLLYVMQKGLWLKDLDLTGYVRFNGDDDSRLTWLELRNHWRNYDLTLQLQHNTGSAGSEFGILPEQRVMQVLGTYYF
jgi:hypothetical protein